MESASSLRARVESALARDYRLDRELGGGGMARVFVAEERALERDVVIKVLAPELAAGISAERFAREVRLAARLQHPHIVPLLAAGVLPDGDALPFYTMPFVAGESLRARLTRDGALAVRDAVAIVRDVAQALAYAHAQGVVHRDVKPDNILLAGGTAVVADFGIAKAVAASSTRGVADVADVAADSTLTQLGTALGTPAYMAPEQAAGDPSTDARADLYALGAVAYEMLAGEPPFAGRSTHALVRAHLVETPAPIASRRPDIPPPLARLVDACLAKSPDDRPPSADALLAALDGDAPAGDAPAIVRHSARRRVTPIAAGALLGVLLVVAAVVVGVGVRQWRRHAPAAPALDASRVLVLPLVADADSAALRPAGVVAAAALAEGLSRMAWVHAVEPPADARARRADSPDDVRALAANAGAATVVDGRLARLGDDARLTFRVYDGATGEPLRTLAAARAPLAASDSALRVAIDPLLSTVGFVTHPRLGAAMLPVGAPPRLDAFTEIRAAAELWERPDTQSVVARTQHARRAAALDTGSVQAKLWAVAAVRADGFTPYLAEQRRAMDSLAVIVRRARDRLSPAEARFADVVLAENDDERLDALRALARLAPRAPLAAELPFRLLDRNLVREADTVAIHLHDAARAAGDSSPASEAVFWRRQSDSYHYLGDDARALAAARRARRLAPRDIEARRVELTALAATDSLAAVARALDDLANAPSSGEVFAFVGDVLLYTAGELTAHGHAAEGAATLQRAVRWFEQQTADLRAVPQVQFREAIAYTEVRRYDDARRLLDALLARDPADVRSIGLIGRIAAYRGDSATADAMEARLAAFPARELLGTSTLERATLAAARGRRDDAVRLLQDALLQGRGFGVRKRIHWFTDWRPLRDYGPLRRLITSEG